MKTRSSIFAFIFIFILFAFFQADFLSGIDIWGIKPDLILVFCTLSGFYIAQRNLVLPVIFLAGLIASSFSEAPLFFFPLLYLLSYYTGMFFKKKRFFSNSLLPAIPVLLSSALSLGFYAIFSIFNVGDLSCFSFVFFIRFLLFTLLNILTSFPVAWLINKFIQDKKSSFSYS